MDRDPSAQENQSSQPSHPQSSQSQDGSAVSPTSSPEMVSPAGGSAPSASGQPSQAGPDQKPGIKPLSAILLLVLMALFVGMFFLQDRIQMLASLQQVGEKGLFAMKWLGDTGEMPPPAEYQVGSDGLRASDAAGVAFVGYATAEGTIVGSHYRGPAGPGLVLIRESQTVYDTMTVSDMRFLGFGQYDTLLPPLLKRPKLLKAPWRASEGINEKGLVVITIPTGDSLDVSGGSEKPALSSLAAVRRLLEGSADVEQAIDLLAEHRIVFDGKRQVSYLLADAGQHAAVVSFTADEMTVRRAEEPWLMESSLAEGGAAQGEPTVGPVDMIGSVLRENEGDIRPLHVSLLMAKLGHDSVRWHTVYHPAKREMDISGDRDMARVFTFNLPMAGASSGAKAVGSPGGSERPSAE